MENLKIRVTTEQESKEVQELFFELGYKMGVCSIGFYPAVIITTKAWGTENWCSTRAIGLNNPAHENHKEITLQELRDMVEPAMKESLNDKIATAEVARQQQKNIDATLAERQSQYGSFEDVAFVTENIMATLAKARSKGLQDLPHTHRMALYMIASKMARIVNGDFNHLDSWHDIGGYSKLIEDLITLDQ